MIELNSPIANRDKMVTAPLLSPLSASKALVVVAHHDQRCG